MSDSDMEIEDNDVQAQVQHTIAGLLAKPSDSHNEVKKHLDEKGMVFSRFPPPKSFGPEHKRAALPCKYFAQGRCDNWNSCRFLHVNHTILAGTSAIQSLEERRPLESKEGGRFHLLGENRGTFLVNPSSGQRVFPLRKEIPFIPSLENMGRGSLQKGGAVFTENRPVFVNGISSFPLKSSFVQEHGSSITSYRQTDMGSSGPAWTGSLFSYVPMNQYASNLGHFENRNVINGSGSLPISVSYGQNAESDTTSNKKKDFSNDWEPSEPF